MTKGEGQGMAGVHSRVTSLSHRAEKHTRESDVYGGIEVSWAWGGEGRLCSVLCAEGTVYVKV